jgi:hypothetical protein
MLCRKLMPRFNSLEVPDRCGAEEKVSEDCAKQAVNGQFEESVENVQRWFRDYNSRYI